MSLCIFLKTSYAIAKPVDIMFKLYILTSVCSIEHDASEGLHIVLVHVDVHLTFSFACLSMLHWVLRACVSIKHLRLLPF